MNTKKEKTSKLSPKQLLQLANVWLMNNGFNIDGSPRKSRSIEQIVFERTMFIPTPVGGQPRR